MSLRDYWMSAIGRDGGPVPLPVDLRTPTKVLVLASLRTALMFGGLIAGLGLLRTAFSQDRFGAEIGRQLTTLILLALCGGLLMGAADFAIPALMWPFQRRKLGEGLENTADAWSRTEFDHNIEEIRAQHSKAQGRRKMLHARHLAWLEIRRDAKFRPSARGPVEAASGPVPRHRS